jgi:alpha-D-glucose phosphate-specific phosphoglucomutase
MRIKFGTSGWRAIVSDEFTFNNVRIVTQAIADYVKESGLADKGMIVGYDTRFISEHFADAVSEVLAANGIKSFLTVRDTPTPAIASEIRYRKTAGGINLTASHNPAAYNGIKFSPAWGGPATPEVTSRIESIANKLLDEKATPQTLPIVEAKARGLVEMIDIRPRYLEEIKGKLDLDVIRQAKLKVVADTLYGTGRDYLDVLLQDAGVEVELIHGYRDPYFGNDIPEPNEEHLGELISRVKNSEAHLGLATDGDADRFGIIDSDGTYITPNQLVALLLVHLMESRGWKGSVVRTVATTHFIDAIAEKNGITVRETPVGFKYIGEWMEKEAVIIGGEESGGLSIMGHVPEKDGLIACLLAAELVATKRQPLSKILNELESKYGKFYTGRVDLRLTPEKKEALWNKLSGTPQSQFAGSKIVEHKSVDGIGWKLEDGSFTLVRPSGTEPLLRCYVEALTEARRESLLSEFRNLSF